MEKKMPDEDELTDLACLVVDEGGEQDEFLRLLRKFGHDQSHVRPVAIRSEALKRNVVSKFGPGQNK